MCITRSCRRSLRVCREKFPGEQTRGPFVLGAGLETHTQTGHAGDKSLRAALLRKVFLQHRHTLCINLPTMQAAVVDSMR